MEIAKEYESRKPIFTIPHAKVIELTSLLLEASDRQVEFYAYMQISNRIDLRQTRMDNNLR